MAAARLGRRYIGIDLSMEYLLMSRERLGLTAWDAFSEGKAKADGASLEGLPMFANLDASDTL